MGYSYKAVWKKKLQQWDIYMQEEQCDVYVCSFSVDEEAEKDAFLKSSNQS